MRRSYSVVIFAVFCLTNISVIITSCNLNILFLLLLSLLLLLIVDIDEDGREKGDRSDSWGLVVIAMCVVVAGVLAISVLVVCLMSRRKTSEKPITFNSPFGENLPKQSTGGVSNDGNGKF